MMHMIGGTLATAGAVLVTCIGIGSALISEPERYWAPMIALGVTLIGIVIMLISAHGTVALG